MDKVYEFCYPAVENEMLMREDAERLNGRFYRDDIPENGYLWSIAWVIASKEQTVLHFPHTYGRKVSVRVTNVWNEIIATYDAPGYYKLGGDKVAKLEAAIEVNADDEQDWMAALDVQNDMSITDLELGGNEYEDTQLEVVPTSAILPLDVHNMSAKEFFAVASTIVHHSPPLDKKKANWLRKQLRYTETAPVKELEDAKEKALKRLL